jgi:hypothetical protein
VDTQQPSELKLRVEDYYQKVKFALSPLISRTVALSVALTSTLLLTSCGVQSGDTRPSDGNLISGINLLISNFDSQHPSLVMWKTDEVKAQLAQKLPAGIDTEAGWLLQWPHATSGELSQVVVPWSLLAQYPNSPTSYFNHYKGGKLVPQATSVDLVASIIQKEMQGDKYFGAVVNIRSSSVNPQWIIFTTVPYLPVTDIAYGFATVKDKKWQVVDFGTALVGCGTVPADVEAEFGFTCQASGK